jgi:hypothetical protein
VRASRGAWLPIPLPSLVHVPGRGPAITGRVDFWREEAKSRRTRGNRAKEKCGAEVVTPGREVETPGREVETPGWKVETPASEVETPGRKVETPGRKVVTPGREVVTPGREVETPAWEVETPACLGRSSSQSTRA